MCVRVRLRVVCPQPLFEEIRMAFYTGRAWAELRVGNHQLLCTADARSSLTANPGPCQPLRPALDSASRHGMHASHVAPSSGRRSDTGTRAPAADLDAATRARIEAFAEPGGSGDGDSELCLPLSLTAFQRRQVHTLAQQLGLGHRSVGTKGATRRIILTRTSP